MLSLGTPNIDRSHNSGGGDDMTGKLSPIFYRCPSCGATTQRVIPHRGGSLKCYRCGMLMLEVVE